MKYLFRIESGLSKDEQKIRVENYLKSNGDKNILVFFEDNYKGFDVYSYESAKYILTSDIHFALFGNAPLALNKNTGEVFQTGTAFGYKKYIDEYIVNIDNKDE